MICMITTITIFYYIGHGVFTLILMYELTICEDSLRVNRYSTQLIYLHSAV